MTPHRATPAGPWLAHAAAHPYVGRGTRHGNPFRSGSAAATVANYQRWRRGDPTLREIAGPPPTDEELRAWAAEHGVIA